MRLFITKTTIKIIAISNRCKKTVLVIQRGIFIYHPLATAFRIYRASFSRCISLGAVGIFIDPTEASKGKDIEATDWSN